MDAARIGTMGRIARSTRMIAMTLTIALLVVTAVWASGVGRSGSLNEARPRTTPLTANLADGSRAAMIHRETGRALAHLARLDAFTLADGSRAAMIHRETGRALAHLARG
jgi:hypothetical protein